MLILIIGGAYQGKHEFAEKFNLPIISNLHEIIRELMNSNLDVKTEIMKRIANKNIVVVCNEIGCGVIPVEKFEREYRETTGRILCDIAKNANEVYKVEAGIAQKIKG